MTKRADDIIEGCIGDLGAILQCLRSSHSGTWIALDLTMSQVKLLMATLHHGGMTSRALAEKLGIGPSAVTPLVDKLVQQKLLKRENDENDRRVIWIRPTAKAYALHERLMTSSHGLLRDLLAEVGADDLATVQSGLAILGEIARKRRLKETT